MPFVPHRLWNSSKVHQWEYCKKPISSIWDCVRQYLMDKTASRFRRQEKMFPGMRRLYKWHHHNSLPRPRPHPLGATTNSTLHYQCFVVSVVRTSSTEATLRSHILTNHTHFKQQKWPTRQPLDFWHSNITKMWAKKTFRSTHWFETTDRTTTTNRITKYGGNLNPLPNRI